MKISQIIEAQYHGLAEMVECPNCKGKGWYWHTSQYSEEDFDHSKEPCDMCDTTGSITRQKYLKHGYDKIYKPIAEATHIKNQFGKQLRDLLNSVPATDFASDDFVVDMSYGKVVQALIDTLGEPDWHSPDYGDDIPYWYLNDDKMVVTVDVYAPRVSVLHTKITAEYDPNGMRRSEDL